MQLWPGGRPPQGHLSPALVRGVKLAIVMEL
jgi:hypothetical protein